MLFNYHLSLPEYVGLHQDNDDLVNYLPHQTQRTLAQYRDSWSLALTLLTSLLLMQIPLRLPRSQSLCFCCDTHRSSLDKRASSQFRGEEPEWWVKGWIWDWCISRLLKTISTHSLPLSSHRIVQSHPPWNEQFQLSPLAQLWGKLKPEIELRDVSM